MKNINEQNNFEKFRLTKPTMGNIIIASVLAALTIGIEIYFLKKTLIKEVKNEISKTQQILQQQINELKMQLLQFREDKETVEYFKVYGADKEVNSEEVNFYIAIEKNLSLLEKLRLIADRLSRFKFNHLPIKVLKIENINGKKIAIIELKERKGLRVSWRFDYFQGSAGGHFTTITLTKTFLQKNYKGKWIDGIKFYYEDKPISGDWDHIFLSGIIYREELTE